MTPVLLARRVTGRLRIQIRALWIGSDLQVMLCGGDAHIGAVALASPCGYTQVSQIPEHREAEIAVWIAARLASDLNCNVAVVAGIHYDGISALEIEQVLELARLATEDLLAQIKAEELC